MDDFSNLDNEKLSHKETAVNSSHTSSLRMSRKKKANKTPGSNGVEAFPSSASSSCVKQVTFDGSIKPESDYYIPPSGRGMVASPSVNTLNRLERQRIVLWRRPIQTIHYTIRELLTLSAEWIYHIVHHKWKVFLSMTLCFSLLYGYHTAGPHQVYVRRFEKRFFSCLYWIGLGILSSVGLGTGLHTFILYLGPHIASVTMAAYECQSLDFPEPPYPDRIICPHSEDILEQAAITMWSIMSKVRFESLMWGAGTALGELPPYFMARAARISGEEPDSEEYREFLAYIGGDVHKKPSFADQCKQYTEKLVSRLGFPGILIFASVPNPFFDLAGITCGHFLVPFWTFFGATLVGKALFKMHMQMLFVVLSFSQHHIDSLISHLKQIPYVGKYLPAPIEQFLEYQKMKLHHDSEMENEQAGGMLQKGLSLLVTGMVIWFLLSIVNSLAQNYHKRMCDKKKKID